MEKEKLILSENNGKFYLTVLKDIKIGDNNVIYLKYLKFYNEEDIVFSKNKDNIGQKNNYDNVYLLIWDSNKIIIPKGIFELNKDVFDRLNKVLKNYDNIFEIELREFYSDSNDDFENYKVNIDYEMIKLENPIKKKNYLFRLKDNNIPNGWVEQSEYLIKRLENLNSKFGNISQNKINLIDFKGCIPKNICFMISEEYAKRLDELFKSWNDGNKKSKRMKLVEYLFNVYKNDVTSNKEYYSIKVDERLTLLVDVEKLEILEFKTMYHNIDISSFHKLVDCISNIQKEIDNIKLS